MPPSNNIFERMRQVRRRLPQLAPLIFNIRTKEEMIVPYQPKPLHTRIWLDDELGADIILKARQLGISTLTVLEFLAYLLFVDGFSGLIISEDERKAKQLLQIAWLALDMLPEQYRVPLKYGRDNYIITEAPIYKTVNGVRKRVGGGRGSSLYIGTAKNFTSGRGLTYHAVHMSELAFWPAEADKDASDVLAGLEEAVPDKPGAIIRIESTANGLGNVFHVKVQNARMKQGRYRFHFYPWWFAIDDEYRKPVREPLELTEDELRLVEMAKRVYGFTLTREHIQWRRDKIIDKTTPHSGEMFWQEYPEDPDSCFLATGSGVYQHIQPQLFHIRKRLEGEFAQYERDRHGVECHYWKHMRPGYQYVIGVDMSEGEKEKSDFHALVLGEVREDQRFEECVTAQGRVSAPTFAQVIMELAHEFNGALIAVERASKGFSVLDILMEQQDSGPYNYGLYYHLDFDQMAGKESKIPGFRPTKPARDAAIQRWGTDLTSGLYVPHEPLVIGQALAFQHNPRTGKAEAPKGSYDDLLNAAFIANYVKDQVADPQHSYGVVEWE